MMLRDLTIHHIQYLM